MKLSIQGNRLYADNMLFSHCEVKHGIGHKPFSGTVRPQYSHAHGRDLPNADGLGWMGADSEGAVVLGRVIDGNGSVLPCRATESRLMSLINAADDVGQHVTLEIA